MTKTDMSVGTHPSTGLLRRSLLPPLFALLASEIVHISATLANHGHPEPDHAAIGRPLHTAAVLLTIGVIVWVALGRAGAARLTVLSGAGVVVAALVDHVLPANFGYNNPFWEEATVLQWAGIGFGLAAGAWCIAAGLRASRLSAV